MFTFASFVQWTRDPIPRLMLGAGVATMLIAAWILLGGRGDAASDKKNSVNKIVRCSSCDLVTMYNPSLVDHPCIKCRKGVLVAKSRGDEAPELSPLSRVLIFAFLGVVVVQGLVYAWAIRFGVRLEDDARIHCRCPACKRKFAYRASKAGMRTRCTRCKSEFELPAPSNPT
jgi:hypothetical protein